MQNIDQGFFSKFGNCTGAFIILNLSLFIQIQADLAVLVISARKGEFETGFERGGQTREHAMLVKTAGVKHMVVLINKMDDPTVQWDQKRYNLVRLSLT